MLNLSVVLEDSARHFPNKDAFIFMDTHLTFSHRLFSLAVKQAYIFSSHGKVVTTAFYHSYVSFLSSKTVGRFLYQTEQPTSRDKSK